MFKAVINTWTIGSQEGHYRYATRHPLSVKSEHSWHLCRFSRKRKRPQSLFEYDRTLRSLYWCSGGFHLAETAPNFGDAENQGRLRGSSVAETCHVLKLFVATLCTVMSICYRSFLHHLHHLHIRSHLVRWFGNVWCAS